MNSLYVISISSEKGGVGKTTLATNLAIYLKALNEEMPITLFSLDNHFTVDKMFRIGRSRPAKDISDLFRGEKAEDLVETGEFGVQFIPSSYELNALRPALKSPDRLARALALSSLRGLVIIDTRPDVDSFTRNALYAADRVVVPVKDAASLTNCKHLYDFFDQQQLPRKTLRILPCLVDSRISYKGPFKTPYQLMKAFAINRGYKCMEGFIGKSPKVESLNTNPEGKIYPILTHGRGTEVHAQFANIARQLYLEMLKCEETRIDRIRGHLEELHRQRCEAFVQRRLLLQTSCLACGESLTRDESIRPGNYLYYENAAGDRLGFLEQDCFAHMVFTHFYRDEPESESPLERLFRQSAKRCYFALRAEETPDSPRLYFHHFSEEGEEIDRREIDLREILPRMLKKNETGIYRLLETTLMNREGRFDGGLLLLHHADPKVPEAILDDSRHHIFRGAMDEIAARLERRELPRPLSPRPLAGC